MKVRHVAAAADRTRSSDRQARPGSSRIAFLAIFLVLLCASSLPVLALGAEPPEEPTAPSETISPQVMAAATRRYEAEQATAEEKLAGELATPAAEQERQGSQDAYSELSSSEAFELLKEQFAPSIEELNEDPGRFITSSQVEKVLGPGGALISGPEGRREIVEGSIPVTSSLGGEDHEPVDLDLEPAGGSFVPANPLTPTTLPAGAEGRIELGKGLEVELPVSDDHEAVQVGQMTLFYPETEESTDTMVAPVAGGVELFEQLRSAESPDEFRFGMQVPSGARLAETGEGGAEVLDGEGGTLEKIPTPMAVDAQGAEVPTTMTVEGASLVVSVAAKVSETAYPVLLDPVIVTEFPDFTNLWERHESSGDLYGLEQTASDLHLWSGVYTNYEPYTFGYFTFSSPGPTAWIMAGYFNPVEYFPHNCNVGDEPHGYIGIWGDDGEWSGLGSFRENRGAFTYETGYVGNPSDHTMIVGIGNNAGGLNIGCGHDLWLGGYQIQETDETAPSVTISGVPLGKWFDPAKTGAAKLTAVDTGFGVFEVSLGDEGGVTPRELPNGGCTGLDGRRCPREYQWTLDPPYVPGKRTFYAHAQDPLGNTGGGPIGETWVDRDKPEIELTGQFAKVTEEVGHDEEEEHELGVDGGAAENPAHENKVSLATYNLYINATDGSNASPQQMQSGVKTIHVYLDGTAQSVAGATQTCPTTESSCPLSGNSTLKLNGLSAGVHKLKVTATDRVGLVREREIEFEYIPATGEGESQVLEHFPLYVEGDLKAAEEAGEPELAVNVVNGNLVFHQQDAELATADAGLPVERFYNSALSKEQSGELGAGWTLADTPELEVGAGGAGQATIVQGDGTVETTVPLPAQEGQRTFDPTTQESIEKTAGGYTVTDEAEEPEPIAELTPSGEVTELEGSAGAAVEVEHEAGELSEIAVDDPGTAVGAAEQGVTESSSGYLLEASAGDPQPVPGELSNPVADATGPSGDIYVADAGHDLVKEFDPSGSFLRQWGAAGAGAGQFSDMVGIAVSPATGDVYVAEPTRIEQFSPIGSYIGQIGSEGAGAGQFHEVTAIACDQAGHLWALDDAGGGEAPHRAQEFSAEGTYMAKVEFLISGVPFPLSSPAGIAIDAEGDFWVADTGRNWITEFSSSGRIRHAFGSAGSGEKQFNGPQGIAIDPSGDIWVADTGNDRVQELSSTGTYLGQAGASGDGDGRLSGPQDVAIDPSGDVWVADTGNDRAEKFTAAGSYSAEAGGPPPGALSRPVSGATDPSGDLYVADAGHDLVQEFDPSGSVIRQWGGTGTGGGQFEEMTAITVSPSTGDVYVAEPTRIEEFSATGSYVGQIGSEGTGTGQFTGLKAISFDEAGAFWTLESGPGRASRVQAFSAAGEYESQLDIPEGHGAEEAEEPDGLVVEPTGNSFWIADTGNDRLEQFGDDGGYKAIGESGDGAGQLSGPRGMAIGESGDIFVADSGNDRIEAFTPSGGPVSRFGRTGAGPGQLSRPQDVSVDPSGNAWVADTGNDRIEKWTPSEPQVTPPPVEPVPAASVETSDGLVEAVEGEATGDIGYQHEGALLSKVEGFEITTSYTYSSTGLLTLVEMSNGTKAEIAYSSGRVSSLKISIEGGTLKTTKFEYPINEQGARETVVHRPSKPATHYLVGEEGSVLRWWNTPAPPEIEELGGSLWSERTEVNPGTLSLDDQDLEVEAYSPEGIASIEIVANGDRVVGEKDCEKEEDWECTKLEKIFVTETQNWTPGIVQFEVIVTDAIGGVSSERFEDNFPYTPPPANPEIEPPTFEEVLKFREEYGLDLDLKGNERALDERIFDLIDAWHEPNSPEGQIARSSWERWGMPLRAVDVAELEYREWFYNTNAERIDKWVEETEPANFGGYYLDNRAGGIMHIGFLGDQEEQLNQLKASLSLVASERLKVYQVPPTVSYLSERQTAQAVVGAIEATPGLSEIVTSVRLEKSGTLVHVGATNIAQAESTLLRMVPGAHLVVQSEPQNGELLSGRYRNTGRMRGGDAIFSHHDPLRNEKCSAGFGAKEKAGEKNGQATWRLFVLMAGHCTALGQSQKVYRSTDADQEDESHWAEVGEVTRSGYRQPGEPITMDASAIRVQSSGVVPQAQWGAGGNAVPTEPAGTARVGNTLCFSGITTPELSCGQVTEVDPYWAGAGDGFARAGYWVKFSTPGGHGDSGAPVWSIFGPSIGLISAKPGPGQAHGESETFVEPLLTPPGLNPNKVYGVLTDPHLRPLSLKIADDRS